jgi:hypothetical protein
MSCFCTNFEQKLHSSTVIREKLCKTLPYKKAVCKMLVKLTHVRSAVVLLAAVVNFINILRAKFTYESLFGSFFYLHVTREKLPKRHSYVKFARKLLMKLTTVLILYLTYSWRIRLWLCEHQLLST